MINGHGQVTSRSGICPQSYYIWSTSWKWGRLVDDFIFLQADEKIKKKSARDDMKFDLLCVTWENITRMKLGSLWDKIYLFFWN